MKPKGRYFKSSSRVFPQFKWSEPPVSPPAGDRSQYIHYNGFTLGELSVSVGEYVIIKNTDTMNQDILDCDVARLEELYQNFENKSEPYRAVIKWLCRPEFLPKSLSSHGWEEQGASPFNNKYEVVGEAREFEKDISAETIYYKCNVVEATIEEHPVDISKRKGEKYPCYMHRFNMVMTKKDGKKNGKKIFSVEPVIPVVKKNKSNRKVLGSRSISSTEDNLGKRKASEDVSSTNKRFKNDPKGDCDSSPELSGFVVGTPEKRISKNPKRKDYAAVVGDSFNLRERKSQLDKIVSTPLFTQVETSTGSGRKVTIKCGDKKLPLFTQIETSTGSGRKLTIKCGDKKFAPSSGLVVTEITSLLDSDEEFQEVTKKTKNTRKVIALREKRPRRASESSTTLSRPVSITPKKPIKMKPASETKKPRKEVTVLPTVEVSDSDFEVEDMKKNTKPKKRVIVTQRRTRRASVSCATPKRGSKPIQRRPVSETKKSRKKALVSDSDESSTESESNPSSTDEEEEVYQPIKKGKTPTKTSAPTSARTPKREFKPRVASRSVLLNTKVDPLTEAQQRLHVSAVPDSLPCREEEFAEIFGYVESRLNEETGGCCYISGVPGTGKTATVMEVMRYLMDNKEDYPDFNFYAMNGMRLTSPDQAYVEMWKQMTGEKATAEHAMKLLDKRFSTKDPKRISTILLVDELDMLCNRKQSVLYNIFDWPTKPHSKLIVIAIANTMDLPERVMINRVSSRLGLTRQTFQPYTHTQLQTIVASRLDGLQVFQQDAIQLVARKVASLSGDARRALDICRRATEMAETAGENKIGVQYVTKAHMEMFTSPKIMAIRSCSKYEQMLLKVMVGEFHRTGVEETTVGAMFRELKTLLRTEGLAVISLGGSISIMARLSALRLILAEHFKFGLMTKLRLNVAMEDIDFALQKVEE